eukprot:scaffold2012_cov134-Skeletonema_dohrnii-CCMP3373.AAC.4
MDKEINYICCESTTSSSSAAAAAAVGHADDAKSSMTKTDTRKSDDNNTSLKEDECGTTDTDLTDGNAKQVTQNDEASAQSQSLSHEATFPQQLMNLIESETTDDNAVTVRGQKAIEWLSTGDRFIIRDKVALESCVLPKYFNNKCKYMSFVRKLYR